MNGARLVLIAAVAVACGGGGGSDAPTGPPAQTPVFTSLTVTPTSASLYSVAPENTVSLTATARDQNNQAMSLGAASFTSSSDAVATVSNAGVVTAVQAGSAQITASLTSAGTTRTANAVILVQEAPDEATVTAPQVAFLPNLVHISAGGTVTWTFAAIPHTVNFSTAGAPADVPHSFDVSTPRTFPNSGTFPYFCAIHAGMTGSVVVH
jgi:plastocyanin